MQLEQGVVESVAEVAMGDELVAVPTATTLTLGDAVDFNEDGGTALVGDPGELVTYTSADLDADTLTLAAPLVGTYAVGDPVRVSPEAVERVATVRLDADGEAVEARVPHALYDRIPEGVRDVGERVSLSLDGGEWVVADVLGQQPFVDASYIDPDTLPASEPPATSDGIPPASSPAPVLRGGIGTLFVRWAEVANADPVTYDVHASTVAGFTPDATTLVGTALGIGPVVIRTLQNGTALQAGTTYRVRIVARDADGAAAPGTEASGSPVQATSEDIAANAITADMLVANDALIDALEVVDLSVVSLESVNIDGGSIAIATSQTGSIAEGFSGTAFPAGWSNVKTGWNGTGAGDAAVPGASVVNSGIPAGGTGSAVLVDYGAAGINGPSAAGKVVTPATSIKDAEATIRLRLSLNPSTFKSESMYLALRRQGLANDGTTEDAIMLDLLPNLDAFGSTRWSVKSRLNGSDAELGYFTTTTHPSTAWHTIRLRIVAGQVQAKAWVDGTTEPEWQMTAQQAGVLTPGEVALVWRQLTGTFAGSGLDAWVDSVNVDTYSTGFTVNPDGTAQVNSLDVATLTLNGSPLLAPGALQMYAAAAPPAGWLLCDGQAVSQSTYAALYAVIGNTFNTGGEAAGTFRVPDLRDRFPVGASASKALAGSGGAATKTILAANLPPHAHSINHGHAIATRETGPGPQSTRVASAGGTGTTSETNSAPKDFTGNSGNGPGTSTPLDVMNPWLAVNYIIKT